MTASTKVGPLTVRPQKIKGCLTGKVFVDIPEAVTEDGKRRRPLFDNRKTALSFANKLWKAMEKDRLLVGQRRPKGSAETFSVVAADWEAKEALRVEAEKKRANSHATDRARLQSLKAFFAEQRVDTLTGADVTRYQAARRLKGVSKGTINSEVSLLLNVLRSKGIARPADIEFYPARNVQHLIPTNREVSDILGQLAGHRKVLVWLCGEAGLRPDEAYHAIWSWFIQDADGYPMVRVAEHAEWMPKTRYSERAVHISHELFEAVMNLPRTSRWVFPSRVNGQKPITSVRKALSAACRDAGIERDGKPKTFSLKMFRKAFGTNLATNRVNRATIQDLVGHRRGSPVTEQFYIFPEMEAARAATAHTRIGVTGADLATTGNDTESDV
jgi:integrase